MIRRQIEHIEQRLRESQDIPAARRDELLAQLAELKAEAESVPRAAEHPLPAESSIDPQGQLTPILNELSASVDGLETSHPRLVQLTNQICLTLANMGI